MIFIVFAGGQGVLRPLLVPVMVSFHLLIWGKNISLFISFDIRKSYVTAVFFWVGSIWLICFQFHIMLLEYNTRFNYYYFIELWTFDILLLWNCVGKLWEILLGSTLWMSKDFFNNIFRISYYIHMKVRNGRFQIACKFFSQIFSFMILKKKLKICNIWVYKIAFVVVIFFILMNWAIKKVRWLHYLMQA